MGHYNGVLHKRDPVFSNVKMLSRTKIYSNKSAFLRGIIKLQNGLTSCCMVRFDASVATSTTTSPLLCVTVLPLREGEIKKR